MDTLDPDAPAQTPAQDGDGKLAVFAAILLGLAATLTAFSAYQAGVADGDVQKAFAESSVALTDSNYFYAAGNQTFAQDQALFVEFATAANAVDGQEAAAYLQTLMRPELVDALDWWQGDEEAVTPFDDDQDNPYVIAEFAEAERLAEVSKQAQGDAEAAGEVGDQYGLSTVLLALTLFFAGIATLFRRRLVVFSLLTVGVVALVAGGAQLAVAMTA